MSTSTQGAICLKNNLTIAVPLERCCGSDSIPSAPIQSTGAGADNGVSAPAPLAVVVAVGAKGVAMLGEAPEALQLILQKLPFHCLRAPAATHRSTNAANSESSGATAMHCAEWSNLYAISS